MALYLVTGAAGFIGSALVRGLIDRGESVRGLDNFSTGRRENISEVLGNMEVLEASLLDPDALSRACQGVTYVLHQAAIPSVPRSVAEPLETDRANVEGTLRLLIAAREAGVRRLVYAASSSAYGDLPTLPKREDMLPQPISPYAVSKLAGELYMKTFHRVYGLETVSLRYFNIFGPRQDPASPYSAVLAKFISLMLRGQQPTIFGDGEQSRDFTYVDNVVSANLLACAAPASQVAGETFNIATGTRTTLNQVFALLKKITAYSGPPLYAAARAGDVRHSLADISRAQKQLGYKVEVDREEGLKRTVAWYREFATAGLQAGGRAGL